MVILEQTLQAADTLQGTKAGPFFYNLLLLTEEVVNQADSLQGRVLSEPAQLEPLEAAAAVLNFAAGGGIVGKPRTYSHVAMVASGCFEVPKEYAVRARKSDPVPSVRLRLPTSAITAIRVNPRVSGGPEYHKAITTAKQVMTTETKYLRKHNERPTCAEIHCLCHLAAVDPQTVNADISPVIDMRIRSSGDSGPSLYAGPGQIVEGPGLGRWYRFPLSEVAHIRLYNHSLSSALPNRWGWLMGKSALNRLRSARPKAP